MADTRPRIIFVSGLSGAGKSVVLHTLEDLDFYCIDNLPVSLLDKLSDQIDSFPRLIAIGINARNQGNELADFADFLDRLVSRKIDTELLFLDADNDVLTKRFSETRRKHPLSSSKIPLNDAIKLEQRLLSPLRETADLVIDTSHTSVQALHKLVHDRISNKGPDTLSIQLISFGYKHGIPRDADFVFDVRCLPNPYWEQHLRNYSGKDDAVIDYLEAQPLVGEMLDDLVQLLTRWIPRFESDKRSYLTVAVGCTGGRHRSVYIIDRISSGLTRAGRQIITRHRDL